MPRFDGDGDAWAASECESCNTDYARAPHPEAGWLCPGFGLLFVRWPGGLATHRCADGTWGESCGLWCLRPSDCSIIKHRPSCNSTAPSFVSASCGGARDGMGPVLMVTRGCTAHLVPPPLGRVWHGTQGGGPPSCQESRFLTLCCFEAVGPSYDHGVACPVTTVSRGPSSPMATTPLPGTVSLSSCSHCTDGVTAQKRPFLQRDPAELYISRDAIFIFIG